MVGSSQRGVTDSQAAARLGGTVGHTDLEPRSNGIATGGATSSTTSDSNPVNRRFSNAIRIVTHEYTPKLISEKEILSSLKEKFSDRFLASIQSIGFYQPQFAWILTMKDQQILLSSIGSSMKVNGQILTIQDASSPIQASAAKRKPRTLTFRIKGLPIDTNPEEIKVNLTKVGFKVQTVSKVYAQSELAVKHKIYSDLMDFSVVANETEERSRIAKLAGNHDLTLSGVTYKVNIICFGFCMRCKEEGHTSQHCQEKQSCRFCKSEDHLVKVCPKLVCRHCNKQGHQRKNCRERKRELIVYEFESEQYPQLPETKSKPIDKLAEVNPSAQVTPSAITEQVPKPAALTASKLVVPLTDELIASIEGEQNLLRNNQFMQINEVLQGSGRASHKRSSPLPNSQSNHSHDNNKKNRPLNTYEAAKDIQDMYQLDDTAHDVSDYSSSIKHI